jgi:hypothetical protein
MARNKPTLASDKMMMPSCGRNDSTIDREMPTAFVLDVQHPSRCASGRFPQALQHPALVGLDPVVYVFDGKSNWLSIHPTPSSCGKTSLLQAAAIQLEYLAHRH